MRKPIKCVSLAADVRVGSSAKATSQLLQYSRGIALLQPTHSTAGIYLFGSPNNKVEFF